VSVVCAALNIYLLILLARAILSFFPVRPGTGLASVNTVLIQLTEPVIAPVRRVVPPAGMFDLSFLVVFIAIELVHSALCGTAFL
jgi:YggT family protein